MRQWNGCRRSCERPARSSCSPHVTIPRCATPPGRGSNPGRVRRQLSGVFDPAWAQPMAETLSRLGSEAAWIVHGQGLDELTVAGENWVVALEGGALRGVAVVPEDAGLERAPIEAIRGGDAAVNASALLGVLDGMTGAYRDTVLLNAAAA